MRRRTIVIAVLGVAAIASLIAGVRILREVMVSLRDEPPVAAVWPGPLRPQGPMVVQPMAGEAGPGALNWVERLDTPVAWVDITRLGLTLGGQTHWYIELAGWPPPAARLKRGELIAYGLVLETSGDGIADFVVGIDNDAPVPGDFRVWVTDQATGQTDEQVGPPYGFPVEFAHPDERRPDDPPGPPTMVFTFLGGSAPADLNSMRFYAWASATEAGEIVAWDYAPDVAWLSGLR